MSFLDKMMGGFAKKAEQEQTTALDVMKAKLKTLVYEDELVDELAPIFAKLSTQEGFSKVVELLETKEQQLEKVAGGEWTKQVVDGDNQNPSDSSDDEDEQSNNLSAEDILAQKYKTE